MFSMGWFCLAHWPIDEWIGFGGPLYLNNVCKIGLPAADSLLVKWLELEAV
jgi:hypothetical protein